MPRISPIYTVYFLYWEPISAFLGAIAGYINPAPIILGTTPLALLEEASQPVSPGTKMLMTQICSFWLLFAWNSAFVLRMSKDLNVWKALIVGMCLSDVGHLYGLWTADPVSFWAPSTWRASDWINEGTLLAGLLLRAAFLAGIGARR